MFNWFSKLWRGDLWRKTQPPAHPVIKPRHPHILIVAHTYAQAVEYSRYNLPYHSDWRYACCAEHLQGYRNVTIITLPGWSEGKSDKFRHLVYRLQHEEL